jgi:hypothetical protein
MHQYSSHVLAAQTYNSLSFLDTSFEIGDYVNTTNAVGLRVAR